MKRHGFISPHSFPLGGFNLLPYRQRRAHQCRCHRLCEALLAALAGFALTGTISYIHSQRALHDRLGAQTVVQQRAPQPSEQTLQQQQSAPQSAMAAQQPQRRALEALLTGLAHAYTPDLLLTTLKYEPPISSVDGIARNQTALRHWVRQQQRSTLFSTVEITQMQRQKHQQTTLAFSVRLVLTEPVPSSRLLK
jgi:Tfp pilus assembly protein PilN